MPLYAFACPAHGPREEFAPVAARGAACPDCGAAMRRVYTAPVTDCHSLGRDVFPGRTPFHRRKARNAAQEEAIHAARREARYVGGGDAARFEVHR